ncbi:hypothetical protein PV325_009996 [Microctonus aethiopoides]|nr:hypothetical protein PV325_009996 [Microctonus aethiopoides]
MKLSLEIDLALLSAFNSYTMRRKSALNSLKTLLCYGVCDSASRSPTSTKQGEMLAGHSLFIRLLLLLLDFEDGFIV